MENNFKRFLSLLLALVMVIGMFPMTHAHVHAAEAGLTPVAPETGKTYVICFKADNGDYYAMTSTYANKNNHGTLLTEKVTGTYNEAIGWNLVAADDNGGYYLNAADDGYGLSLNGTIDNDAFADANHPAEIMTLEPSGDGYLIKNPSNRYVNALGAVAGNNSWGACGNWESGTTAYFFEIPEISINLTEGETYEVPGVAEALNVTDNEVIDVESDFVQSTVKNHKLATTIEDGVYVIVNTRSNKWLLNTPVDGATKLQNVAGEPNLGDNAYLWTVTTVEGEADTYYLGNNGKYLNLPGHEQAELVSDENATVKITASTLVSNAWEIFDTNTYMNDLGNAVGSYGGNDEDPGSQWVFFKVSDVPAFTYAGVEELPSDATITSGNEYLLVNIRNGNKTLLNKQNPGANACLYLNGTANAPSNNAVWTITEHEGSYYIQDQNGKYLTFSSSAATVTTDSTPVSIGWQGFGSLGEAWAITRTVNGRKEYMSNPGGGNTNSGGGWHEENDGGSRWKIYTTSTTPVGTYDVTVTGKDVGEATVVIGMAIYTFHVATNHVHNFVGDVTTPANCVDEGVKTFTCECGEGTYTEVIPVDSKNHKTTEIRPAVKPTLTKEGKTEEVYCTACNTSVSGGEVIPQLTMKNAKILDGGEVLALSDCEYVLGGTEGAYSLCHGGTYYVNIRAKSVNCNQTTTASAFLNLDWDDSDGDAVSIWQNTDRTGYLYIHYADAVPKWNVNGSYEANTCDMYLLYADANSTNENIPGYTVADADYVAAHIEEGESYLIAAKNTHGSWFVMVPSVTGNAVGDYIAQVVTDTVTHTHEYTVETVTKAPTCTETGLKDLKCSCGHFHAAEHKNVMIPATGTHTPAEAVKENEVAPTLNSTGSYDLVVRCSVCGTEISREKVTVPALTGAVASVNGTNYATLAEAVAAAETGTTVTLLADTNGDGIIIDKNVTIDLGGFTYTIDGVLVGSTDTKSCGFQILSGNTVTIKNGAIVMDEKAVRGHDNRVGNNFVIQNYANLTLTDVVVTGNSHTSYVVSNNSGNVAFTGNTSITAPEGAVAFDVCKYASYAEPTVTVNTTGTIAGNIEVTGGALTLNAGTFTGALTYTAGTVTKAEAVTLAAPADYKWVNGVLTAKTYVAEADGVKYESLAEAVAVGGEVKLLANTNGNGIIIDKNVTIDLNNYTYTIDGVLVGSTGTKSCGFQILSGNTVVIKNGAIVMDENAVRGHDKQVGNNFVIQNYANLTLENVTVTGNSNTSYVVSNNSGNVAFTGNTSITAPEGAVAFDVCKYLSYAEPTVTVNTTGTIAGNIEVTGGTLTLTAATINGALVYEAGTVTKAETVTLAAPADYKWVNGVLTAKTYVAQVGDTKYESLAEAVEKAADGTTVTLLANTNGNGIIIDKNVTIDLNNYTYTIDGTLVGSTGTKSCGFQILSGKTVTIKNGSIVMGEGAVRGHDHKVGNNFVIQNYANMTLENVTVIGNSYTSYVVSNNSGNVAFTGNTSITAKKAGAVAFDVCKYASYAEPTVTVAETVVIDGKIEAAAKVGNVYYATFEKALASGNEITLLVPVTVTKDTTYDLTGKTIISKGDAFVATSGTLTLNGDGIIKAGTAGVGSWCAVWANGGHVDINGGTYSVGGDRSTTDVNHQNDLIYTKNGGTVTINGGTFLYTEGVWTLNQNDKTGGKIVVYGGTFYKWNPSNNNSEGPNTSFVAEGYCASEKDGIYTVQAHVAAEAVVENNVAPTCTVDGSYDTVVYCSICNAEMSRVTTTVSALGHTAGEAVVENVTATSYESVVYCSVCDAELSRETVVENKVVVMSMNVSLDAEIKMIYTVAIPDALVENGAYIVMTKEGGYGTVVKEYKDLTACKNADGNYVVEIGIASGEMTCPIKIEVFDGKGVAQNLYNKKNVDQGVFASRTVVDFARTALKNEKNDANKKALLAAMVTYGGYAQVNFNVDVENPAYNLLKEEAIAEMNLHLNVDSVTADMVADYTNKQTNSTMGVKASSITTVVDSSIYIRVYLTVDGNIDNYTFTVKTPEGVKNVKAGVENGRYYVDITDIASAYIDYEYTITVSNGTETNEITTSVLSYVRSVLSNSKNSKEKKDLVKALYLYNQAANAFWPDR